MAIEDLLTDLAAALRENTAAVTGKPATAAAADGKKPPGRPKKVSFEAVKAIAQQVAVEKGKPVAVQLIKNHGAAQLAELEEAKYSAFVAAAEVILKAEPEAEDDPAEL